MQSMYAAAAAVDVAFDEASLVADAGLVPLVALAEVQGPGKVAFPQVGGRSVAGKASSACAAGALELRLAGDSWLRPCAWQVRQETSGATKLQVKGLRLDFAGALG